ncbi:MAG: aconitate hydratase AcnA [Planctomycetota bacterium]
MTRDTLGARDAFETGGGPAALYRLSALEKRGVAGNLARLPYSLRILLEMMLRAADDGLAAPEDAVRLANAPRDPGAIEIPFRPARVLMQDFTGVPAVADLAAMRSAAKRLGADPRRVNPLVPVDLVIDHSVQVDAFGAPDALGCNEAVEFRRNGERYAFLRWARAAFANFRVIPPGAGICHQVNLEFLAKVVLVRRGVALPDTLVGTDSHTTMINGLGVLGWGVGGIEAGAAMLGQPLGMPVPPVVGVRLAGRLRDGVGATDLALAVTAILRKKGVVEKFVEFFGPALAGLSLPDRATVANMAPEYGATAAFFPVDDETLKYLRLTNRTPAEVTLVERYTKEQSLFRRDDSPDPEFSDIVEINLAAVEPCLAGPKRPQDRVLLSEMKDAFRKALAAPAKERGFGVAADALGKTAAWPGSPAPVGHGAVCIAAITSCTNTANPSLMIAAGLLARKAAERGLKPPPHVKTSLSPGSTAVTEYLRRADLLPALERLGFHVTGHGCMTCIGNSGPLASPDLARAIRSGALVAAAVISGNRNFEGRIHPLVRANYLASPLLVVAYALAGTVDIDMESEPLGAGADGKPVFLRDLRPDRAEIEHLLGTTLRPELFRDSYANVLGGSPAWNAIRAAGSDLYPWDAASTYIQEPPFFANLPPEPPPVRPIRGARVLAYLGDSVTTDHISPAGDIAADGPAGKYLLAQGVAAADFNSFGARRGNDRVMTRGTFSNLRLKNRLVHGVEGGVTRHFGPAGPGEILSIFDAAELYRAGGVPLIVIAGKEYGTGSSRDWAAKGVALLGVRAVLAESFERIHRSNLIGMGVLPLQFRPGDSADALGISGNEIFHMDGLDDRLGPRQEIAVRVETPEGAARTIPVTARLDTPVEVEYYRQGGILPAMLRKLIQEKS